MTAIAQDHATGEILMVAYMNEESFAKTLELGEVVYWSHLPQRALAQGREQRERRRW